MAQLLMFENEPMSSISMGPCSTSSVVPRKGSRSTRTSKKDHLQFNTVCKDLKFNEICQSVDAAQLEETLRREGYSTIAGVDEAGRGPLAGPVVACACIVPSHLPFYHDLNDSKKLSAIERERLYALLVSHSEVDFAIGIISHDEIDRINILQATFKAMRLSVSQLKTKPSCLLIDGDKTPPGLAEEYNIQAVIKGDSLCPSISAASIIAKVTRDRIVDEYDALWPHFKFKSHKGYGTKLHLKLLEEFGPLPVHRKTFRPISDMTTSQALTLF